MNKNLAKPRSVQPKRHGEGLCEGFPKFLMLKYITFHASSLFIFYASLFPPFFFRYVSDDLVYA